MTTLAKLAERATNGMREYVAADTDARGGILRRVAEALVEARGHFYNKDGEPDWTGKTHAYRMFVREATAAANIPPAERTSLQASIRWHVGAVLRDRLDAETLEAIGLQAESPRERNVRRRAEVTAARSLIGPGPEITSPDDIVALADLITVTIARIPDGIAETFSAKDYARVEAAFAPISERLLAARMRRNN